MPRNRHFLFLSLSARFSSAVKSNSFLLMFSSTFFSVKLNYFLMINKKCSNRFSCFNIVILLFCFSSKNSTQHKTHQNETNARYFQHYVLLFHIHSEPLFFRRKITNNKAHIRKSYSLSFALMRGNMPRQYRTRDSKLQCVNL